MIYLVTSLPVAQWFKRAREVFGRSCFGVRLRVRLQSGTRISFFVPCPCLVESYCTSFSVYSLYWYLSVIRICICTHLAHNMRCLETQSQPVTSNHVRNDKEYNLTRTMSGKERQAFKIVSPINFKLIVLFEFPVLVRYILKLFLLGCVILSLRGPGANVNASSVIVGPRVP